MALLFLGEEDVETPVTTTQPTPIGMRAPVAPPAGAEERSTMPQPARPDPVEGEPHEEPGYGHGV